MTLLVLDARAPRSETAAQPAASGAVTARDQVDVAVTVYNGRLALVRDVRRVALPGGASTLRFEDIAASINPAAVHVRSLTAPAGLDVLEQNYQYDLLEPQKLLQKYVGREVTLVRARQEDGSTRYEEVPATLLALNGGPVWRVGSEIVTGLPSDHYRFPAVPDDLYSAPTLIWKLENTGPREQQVELSYLTGGIGWSADYVLTVARDDKTAGLDGWVTLTNESGAAYRDATLQLVAGEINRVYDRHEMGKLMEAADAMRPAAPQFVREAFSEYHLYALGRRTSIGQKETKQINLLGAPAVPVVKRFVVNGDYSYYRAHQPGAAVKDRVEVFYRFENHAAQGLGQPLPAGVVRVYQADAKGGIHFVGEDRIDHTPANETLDLHVGNAFDVICERKQTDFRRLASDVREAAYEVRIRNHKTSSVQVEINEPIGGDWEMLQASHRWAKTAAFAARFDVSVPPDGEAVITYRVRIR
jgi:hypothetical protein